jgi:hypothetical protein
LLLEGKFFLPIRHVKMIFAVQRLKINKSLCILVLESILPIKNTGTNWIFKKSSKSLHTYIQMQ